jgi:predicted ATPase
MSAAVSEQLADGTSSKSQSLHMSGRTISVSIQASQRVHVCNFTYVCLDRPRFKSPTSSFQLIYSISLSHMVSLLSLRVLYQKPRSW